jgi:flagellar biosynthesis protein FliQ
MFAQIEYRQGIEEAWADVATFVPKLMAALVVFIIGWFIAGLIRRGVRRILAALQFDRWVDRAGLGGPLERAGWKDSGLLLAQLIYWAVMLLTLQLAVDTFGDSAIRNALDGIVAFLPKLFIALIIVVIAGAVASRVAELVGAALADTDFGATLAKVSAGLVWLVGLFAAFDQIEIAQDIVTTLFQAIVYTIGVVIAIMFGVGGIKAAETEFWPKVFARLNRQNREADTPAPADV